MPFVTLVAGILFIGILGKGASRRTYLLVGIAAAIAAFWELQQ